MSLVTPLSKRGRGHLYILYETVEERSGEKQLVAMLPCSEDLEWGNNPKRRWCGALDPAGMQGCEVGKAVLIRVVGWSSTVDSACLAASHIVCPAMLATVPGDLAEQSTSPDLWPKWSGGLAT